MANEVELTIDDIISSYGAYYKDSGQGMANLRKKLYQPSETAAFFNLQIISNTVDDQATAEMGDVLQAYQDDWTPKGDVEFKPVRIPLFHMKIDWEKNPFAFLDSWLGFLGGDDKDPVSWPLIRYIIEEHIIPKAEENYELKGIYSGKYLAPVKGTAGSPHHIMDGIATTINHWIDADRTDPLTTGPLETDATDFVDQVEDFCKQIPLVAREKIKYIFINKNKEVLYREGKREKYNQNYNQEDLMTIAQFPWIKIQGLASMATSEKIWTSIPEYMVHRQKRSKNKGTFKIESIKRSISLYTDYYDGVGFVYPEYIYANDQELTVPVS